MNVTTQDLTITEEKESTVDTQQEQVFKIGDVVKVSDSAVADGRSFDFGEVTNVNEDGTVAVLWSRAGCGCSGIPNESTAVLTQSSSEAYDDYLFNRLSSVDDDDEDYDDYEDDEDEDDEDEE